MTADTVGLLRRAVAVLRDAAGMANTTPSRWYTFEVTQVIVDDESVGGALPLAECHAAGDARYFALVDPAVAFAVADVLVAEICAAEAGRELPEWSPLVVLARVILRDSLSPKHRAVVEAREMGDA